MIPLSTHLQKDDSIFSNWIRDADGICLALALAIWYCLFWARLLVRTVQVRMRKEKAYFHIIIKPLNTLLSIMS